MTYIVSWWRAQRPHSQEIGPVLERETIHANTKKRAAEYAKAIAKERDWRVIEVIEVSQ